MNDTPNKTEPQVGDQPHRTQQASTEEKLRLLRLIPLFREVPPSALSPVAQAAELSVYEPGGRIVRQGEPGDSIYFIVDGNVQVVGQLEREGTVAETVIAWLGTGDVVGELSILDGEPRSASCIAVTTTTCLGVGRDAFLAVMQQHWSFTLALLRVLASRIRNDTVQLSEHARDPLTGLSQRRAAADFFERELAVARRSARKGQDGWPLTMIVVDVDRLRHINDRQGHAAGDDVLRAVARALTDVSRATDLVARYDGDEFMMLLPEAGKPGAERVVRRLKALLAAAQAGLTPFTASVGIAMVDENLQEPLGTVLDRARASLRQAKTGQPISA